MGFRERFLRATANLHVGSGALAERLAVGRVLLFDGQVVTQTTLLGLSVSVLLSLPRTWKAVMSIKIPNAMA